jgi:hypothetical protein
MIPNAVIEEKKNGLLAIVQRVLSNAESNGMPFTHTDNVTYHFQCRLVDRTNWSGLRTIVESQADMNTVPMRCKENVWLMLDRQTALDTLLNIGLYYMALKQAETHVKDNLIPTGNYTNEQQIEQSFQQVLQAILA